MPDVKWADPHDLTDGPERFTTMPVLTLDQLAAWLRQEYELSQTNGERGYMFGLDLLAQVRAWKESK